MVPDPDVGDRQRAVLGRLLALGAGSPVRGVGAVVARVAAGAAPGGPVLEDAEAWEADGDEVLNEQALSARAALSSMASDAMERQCIIASLPQGATRATGTPGLFRVVRALTA